MKKLTRWLSKNLIRVYAFLGFTYLFIPVFYTFAFSFNDAGRSNLVWKGFTVKNWKNPCGAPDICMALGNSLKIGLISTILATILGTLIAFALGRYSSLADQLLTCLSSYQWPLPRSYLVHLYLLCF